nr:hypothetical protein [Tateyamaria pelophila]
MAAIYLAKSIFTGRQYSGSLGFLANHRPQPVSKIFCFQLALRQKNNALGDVFHSPVNCNAVDIEAYVHGLVCRTFVAVVEAMDLTDRLGITSRQSKRVLNQAIRKA